MSARPTAGGMAVRHPSIEQADAAPTDALRAALSNLDWLAGLPLVLLHEATHAMAAFALNIGLRGAGVIYSYEGHFGPVPLYRVGGFFVMTERRDGGWRDRAVTLAPLLWLPLGALVMLRFFAVGGVLVLVGLTGLSDVATMSEHVEAEGRLRFLVGGPPQWQTTLGGYS